MPRVWKCAIPGCGGRTPEVSLHKMPGAVFRGNPNPRRAVWIEACGFNEAELAARTMICSRHFAESDINPATGFLLPNAVPSRNLIQPVVGEEVIVVSVDSDDKSEEAGDNARVEAPSDDDDNQAETGPRGTQASRCTSHGDSSYKPTESQETPSASSASRVDPDHECDKDGIIAYQQRRIAELQKLSKSRLVSEYSNCKKFG